MQANMTSMGTFLKACSQELEIQPSSPALTRRIRADMPETTPVQIHRAMTSTNQAHQGSPSSRRSSLGDYFSVSLGSSPTSLEAMEGRPHRTSMGEYFSWLVTPQKTMSKRDINIVAPTST